jgi:hypothetical protein
MVLVLEVLAVLVLMVVVLMVLDVRRVPKVRRVRIPGCADWHRTTGTLRIIGTISTPAPARLAPQHQHD